MKKIFGLFIKFPIICAGCIFLIFAFPINYFFLRDQPDNPLEQIEEAVIKSMTGIDVDLNPQ